MKAGFYPWIAYSKVHFNTPGNTAVVGIESVLRSFHFEQFGFIKYEALILTAIAFAHRKMFDPIFTVCLFFIISLSLVYGHDADYVTILLYFSYLILHRAVLTNKPMLINSALAITFLMFIPAKLLKVFIPLHMHVVPTIALIISALFYVYALIPALQTYDNSVKT